MVCFSYISVNTLHKGDDDDDDDDDDNNNNGTFVAIISLQLRNKREREL
jgi:hypothetical protein